MTCEDVLREESILIDGVHLTYTLSSRRTERGMHLFSLTVTEAYRGKKERIILYDLTNDRAEAERLFLQYYEGAVTVCTAEDVLTELLYTP